jgi:hypothetical protein
MPQLQLTSSSVKSHVALHVSHICQQHKSLINLQFVDNLSPQCMHGLGAFSATVNVTPSPSERSSRRLHPSVAGRYKDARRRAPKTNLTLTGRPEHIEYGDWR